MSRLSREQIEDQSTNSSTLSLEQLTDLVGNIFTEWHAGRVIPWNSVDLAQQLVHTHFGGNAEAAAKKLGINPDEFKSFGAFNVGQ